jgi:hypothetical protein
MSRTVSRFGEKGRRLGKISFFARFSAQSRIYKGMQFIK